MARIRKGSGLREADLVARSKALRADVGQLLPRLTPDCPPERFERLRAELEDVVAYADDPKRLLKLAHRGEPIARALAGLLKFAQEPATPIVISIPTATGEVSYAPLSKTDHEVEVAVQRSDEPERLLLAYLSWARRGFHFFATHKVLWCTGRSPQPPVEFVAERVAELPYRLVEDPATRRYRCPHLAAGEPRPYLEVGWVGAERAFQVCRRCVKDDRHLLGALSSGAAVPDPEAEFPVAVALHVDCRGGDECVHRTVPGPPKGLVQRYVVGRLSDAGLLDGYLAEVRPRIERTGTPTFVAGGVCYGGSLDAFLEALGPSPVERRALTDALEGEGGYFEIDERSASRALEKLWATHAETIVRAIVSDPEEARRLVEGARGAPGRVAEILKRLQRRAEERELLETLPQYTLLAPEAAWVDRVARAYRTQGEGGAERAVLQSLPREGKERGFAYGFLLAVGRARAHAWQFSPTEQEFGQALEGRARELLSSPADGYHVALDAFLQAAGVANWGTLASPANHTRKAPS